MRMRVLGGSGVMVSELCFGAMALGSMGNTDRADCLRIIDRALDAGINFIDTSDNYSAGESERIVGEAIRNRRDDVVVATKVYHAMGKSPNERGLSRRWIIRECENSLRRLQTDYIDLYQMHRPDARTDMDETLGAMSDLVHQGKIRAIGTSTFPAEQIVETQWIAEKRGHVRPWCEQPPYSIFVRGIERDVLPTCQRHDLGAVVWSPLNGGWLTGKYSADAPPAEGTRFDRWKGSAWSVDTAGAVKKRELLPSLEAIARDAGVGLIGLSLGFTMSHPAVASTIIGPRTMDQLEDLLKAGGAPLDDSVLDRIDEVVPPGTVVDPGDIGYEPRAIRDAAMRRVKQRQGR